MRLRYQTGCIGAPPSEPTMAYLPSCSTRIKANFLILPLLRPRVVKITTRPFGASEGVGFAAVGCFVTLDLIAHPLARTRLVLPCQWHVAIIDSPSPQARR